MSFRLTAGQNAPKLRSFTIALPRGLSFIRKTVLKRSKHPVMEISAGKVKTLALKHGKLLVTLQTAVSSVTARVAAKGLLESVALIASVRDHRIKDQKLVVAVKDVDGRTSTLTARVR